MQVLGRRNEKVFRAVMETMVPSETHFELGGGKTSGVELLDRYLLSLNRGYQFGIRLLLILVEFGTLLTFFSFRPFTRLIPSQQERYLENWEMSRFFLRRSLFSTLRCLALLMVYSDAKMEDVLEYSIECVKP